MTSTIGRLAAVRARGEAADAPGACPNCENGHLEPFYEVANIPVHSVLLMSTRERALTYPRRDLRLGFCRACGFIANMIFDATVHEYSTSCEETQGYSATFNAFARGLAKRWVEQYHLRGKSVLEIGCGKGEFLVSLVEEGLARGIGVDPAYVPGRLNTALASKLSFIQDLYSENYAHLEADVICCRHTLEHIAPTRRFMRGIRNTLGERRDTLLLFELPDVSRVLEEGAFWDIYYEHCSYFTMGSLARLFRSVGFDPLELALEYDRQYIVLAAISGRALPAPELEGEDDLARTAEIVERFPQKFAKSRDYWSRTIRGLRGEGKRVVLWGGGSKAVAFLTTLGLTEEVAFVVDINPHKHGRFIPGTGHSVRSPLSLTESPPDCVVLMNPVYEQEVRGQLAGLGLHPVILCV